MNGMALEAFYQKNKVRIELQSRQSFPSFDSFALLFTTYPYTDRFIKKSTRKESKKVRK